MLLNYTPNLFSALLNVRVKGRRIIVAIAALLRSQNGIIWDGRDIKTMHGKIRRYVLTGNRVPES